MFHLGEELTRTSKQKISLLKVDFIKAYDKVEHIFLWDTLITMGFDRKFIALVWGLVEEGFSKVHLTAYYYGYPSVQGGLSGMLYRPLLVRSFHPTVYVLAC